MTILHAIWTDASLHIWGEYGSESPCNGTTAMERASTDAAVFALDESSLRGTVGDVYDSLLVSGTSTSSLTLRLPHRDGRPLSSSQMPEGQALDGVVLLAVGVTTLRFAPADAIDLLSSLPNRSVADIVIGDSLRYWSHIMRLVLELLAKQRFVPAIHRQDENTYKGYWRVVVDDEETSKRLEALIVSMPPVCRSCVTSDAPPQASNLVEQFLWATVDAFVRRCLESDDLAHSLQERSDGSTVPQVAWLQTVVRADSTLKAPPEQSRMIAEKVTAWLSKLEIPREDRTCRTRFRIQSPNLVDDDATEQPENGWTLKLYVIATDGSEAVLDAAKLIVGQTADTPPILPRPFDHALDQLRTDAKKAARHFAPLEACAEPDGPVECRLTVAQAHHFLRDAAPLLESDGFEVSTPRWWRDNRPRLRMWLDVRPIAETSATDGSGVGLDALVSYDWRIAVGDEELTQDELEQLVKGKEPLAALRDKWTEIPPADLQAALKFIEDNRGGQMTFFEALRQSYVADDLETGLPVAGIRPHGWLADFFDATDRSISIQRLEQPKAFQGSLRPYQLRGMEWMAFLGNVGAGACLADDMGLGKTIQLIALWLHERKDGTNPGPTLLVVPMSLVGNWQREIQKFGPSLRTMVHHGVERLSGEEFVSEVARHDVVISTYGLTHRDVEHLGAVDWHRIALDEAQNIKNPAAKQARAIRSFRTVHRLALTGTPVENRLTELWSILDFLNTGYLGRAAEFRRRFAIPIERHHDNDRAQRLRQLIRPFVLRRMKNDPKVEVDLPEKMEMKVFCNLTAEQAGLYQTLVDDMLGQIDRTDGIQRRGLILATLIKLKQVCNHPAHYLAQDEALAHRSGKCDRLTEMLEEVIAEEDKALIFTQFRKMGDLLQPLLKKLYQSDVLFLHGGTTRKQRDAIVDRFQDDDGGAPLLILSLKAGGYGLNLTAASHVFHFDRWWNPAVEDQATDRAHRIGQDKRVQVHKFVCVGTLEERIDTILERKRSLAETVVGGGEEWLTDLSTQKLRELFVLSRDAVAEG